MTAAFRIDATNSQEQEIAGQSPLILALPPEIADIVSRFGRIGRGIAGDLVPADGELLFVSSGALAPVALAGRVGTELFAAGSVYGLENLFIDEAPAPLSVVLGAQWIAVTASAVEDVTSTDWGARMFAHQSRRRLRVLSHEAVCGRDHIPSGRTAKVLLKLQDCSASSNIEISQADLAGLVGCRRTTVSDRMSQLQAIGAIRQGRLNIQVRDRDRLIVEACCYQSWR